MKKHQPVTGEDIEWMARDFGKPGPASLRKRVMAGIDEIDREVERGRLPPLPERETPSTPKRSRSKERGRGRHDD